MCKKLIYLIPFVFALGLVSSASAALVAHWKLDNNATDSVGALSWTLNGGASFSTEAREGSHSLRLDGVDDYLSQTAVGPLLVEFSTQTVTLWFKADSTAGTGVLYDEGGTTRGMAIRVNNGSIEASVRDASTQVTVSSGVAPAVWTHVAATFDNGVLKLYVHGIEQASATAGFRSATEHSNAAGLGARNGQDSFGGTATGGYFGGLIDDVRIYDNVLTTAEIQELAGELWPYAYSPGPEDGALYANTWVNLQWTPGGYAVSHDVYFGEDFDDVAAGTGGTFQGNQGDTFLLVGLGTAGDPCPGGLVPGMTYYWRVDEVNPQDPNSPWRGDVWSFSIPSKKAYNPDPPDNQKFVDPDVTLSWTEGFGGKLHYVYFGENAADVEAGSGGTSKGPVAATTFVPGTLANDTRYYWRVDAFDGLDTHTGDVWSFRTVPDIAITDPNLVAWWKLDEGVGTLALDWSGHENHATLRGSVQWTPDGYDAGALNFGSGGYVAIQNLYYLDTGLTGVTVCAWIRTSSSGDQYIASFDRDQYWRLEINGSGGGAGQVGWDVYTDAGQSDYGSVRRVDDGDWHHVCGVFDNGRSTIYIDGYPEPSTTVGTTFGRGNTRYGFIGANSEATSFDGSRGGGNPVAGDIDDLRIYDKALTQAEIAHAMRGDPRLAWDPNPSNRSTPNIDDVKPLTWSPGDFAAQHDVYVGTDSDAVEYADTSDTTGIYRSKQASTSYTPPEPFEFRQTYYWRIDENNTDGTITKGRVWSFTVADFILIDDFEDYDANDNQIWYAWNDGLGYGAVDNPPYSPGNGTGSAVGWDTTASYTEETIVNAGDHSMPFTYDNNKQGFLKYSEAKMTLSSRQRDWTKQGVRALSLWFRGHPGTFSTFEEGPVGTYTMNARCGNIWGTSDQLNYVFMQLTGPGSISAKVESVRNTANDAKPGVMIRETLDPDSKHAFTFMRPDGGVRFNRRPDVAATTTNSVENGLAFPRWVKLERDVSGLFTASHSADGVTWVPVDDQNLGSSDTIPMNAVVYIGLALSSNNTSITCEAVFSDVQVTGQVTGQWQSQDIDIMSNNPEPMYVAVANTNGRTAVLYYEDPNATLIETWTEWNIELKEFSDQGVNLSDVDSIAIGFGNRNNPQSGNAGTMYFDDIRVYRPRCVPSLLKPVASFNNDCVVDYSDLLWLTDDWLKTDATVATAAPGASGLLLHYTFDGNANDRSGNAYHGIEKAGATYVAGKLGQALHLDGLDDYLAIESLNYAATGNPEVSVCAWIRSDSIANQHIVSFDRDEYFRLQIGGEAGGIGLLGFSVMTTDPSGTEVQMDYGSSRRVDDGQWHHVAGTFDNGRLSIYIDGSLETSVLGNVTFGTGLTRYGFVGIGSEATEFNGRPNAAGYYDGDIDDLRIYSRALSQAEIAYLADDTPGDGQLYTSVPSVANLSDGEPQGSKVVNFLDFAVLADQWLDELLWPQP